MISWISIFPPSVYNSLLSLINFMFKLFQADCYVTCPHHFLNISLFSVITRYSRLTLYLPYSSPGISYFFEEPWFLFDGMAQNLDVRCAHCFCGTFASRPCQQSQEIHSGTHAYTYICIHVNVYVCSMYMYVHMYT